MHCAGVDRSIVGLGDRGSCLRRLNPIQPLGNSNKDDEYDADRKEQSNRKKPPSEPRQPLRPGWVYRFIPS
jgi:hypothetical protein